MSYTDDIKEKSAKDGTGFVQVYHGSQNVIQTPQYGVGNPYNDYGIGFYTTTNNGLAGEWAVLNSGKDGYVNVYRLNYTGLSVLRLDNQPFEVGIAILMHCRRGEYADEVQHRLDKFIAKYGIDFASFDIIEGWRANDSFFSYVRDFAAMALSLEKLKEALKLGDLGTQVCLKSKQAFTQLEWSAASKAFASQLYSAAKTRDEEARKAYRRMKEKTKGTLIFDMIGRDY